MKTHENSNIYYANTPQNATTGDIKGEYVSMLDEDYYCIRNYDALNPFFITLISASNHWLFISTTGGLSAGRVDANHALFPYYTVDKITESSENTGSKTLILVTDDERQQLWQPFSERHRGIYHVERNLYKNISGTSVIFEEVNHELGLSYRYMWRTSETYGFVKTAYLINHNDSQCHVEILDGLQNILPAHVTSDLQNVFSNLLDAYKYSQLHPATGLGLYFLSSRLTDLAEPSESLRTNTIWQVGLDNVEHLLSSSQLASYRSGKGIAQEETICGQRGAYFVHSHLTLDPQSEKKWHFVADVEQDSSDVANLIKTLSEDANTLSERIETDIKANEENLQAIVASADGVQVSSDQLSTAHHFANVLFNVMRGGIFANQYVIDMQDLKSYIAIHKPALLDSHAIFFNSLPASLTVSELRDKVDANNSIDLIRLCYNYLPLTFSRRHGDPSRPWNQFQINIKKTDGSQRLDYQGNWRDIFQNWEALSYSYPEFIHNMISVFLNATTVDGYNPYRMTRDGMDWEVPEPDNTWANIGYWSDHQIIYLQKLLEVCENFFPNDLDALLNRRIFSYANVPYQIKRYDSLLENPYNTIDFDWDKEKAIQALIKEHGADGKLVHDKDGQVLHGSASEKLLMLLLAKLVNFVPEGGIWMNTQRPEWNDANNALVGKGLSIVTLAYVRRYIAFFTKLLSNTELETLTIIQEIATLFESIHRVLSEHRAILDSTINDRQRRSIMDALGSAGSDYRWQFYENGVSGKLQDIAVSDLLAFLNLAQEYVKQSLRANKREDNLYHAYNILHVKENSAKVTHLSEMLEGQVAILSSGLLSPDETLSLLQTMRQSALYRADQHSYILYPDRQLPGFLDKNKIEASAIGDSKLVAKMLERKDLRLITKDVNGVYHFNGDIRNANNVAQILETLAKEADYSELVGAESENILTLFEEVFHHASFTGRSGTFFAYEGLGSIYWHMVSKLLLAVQEAVLDASHLEVSQEILQGIIEAYDDVRAGIGFNKTPDVYGAFPTDPYSHTPKGQGAKQPGMTGMVKEEILTRFVELGIMIEDGTIVFNPILFRNQELLETVSQLHYIDIQGQKQQLEVPVDSLAFTFCQIPFLMKQSDNNQCTVHYTDNTVQVINGHCLDAEISQQIYSRNGNIQQVRIFFSEESL